MWTRDAALQFIAELTPAVKAAGYHIGLAGSVLLRGQSEHDLDLIFFPNSTAEQNVPALEAAFTRHGLKKRWDRDFIRKIWRKKGSLDEKHVEAWLDREGRRIDVFLLR